MTHTTVALNENEDDVDVTVDDDDGYGGCYKRMMKMDKMMVTVIIML